MKRDAVQVALRTLADAARRPNDEASVALVRDMLAHRSNHVVARAARAAGEADLPALAPDLIAAFPRFLEDPVRRDPGCAAKTQIVHALLALNYAAPDVYLRGAAHVQREPGFGPPIDTAPELRATSAMALVVMGHPAALTICVNLLVDPEPAGRTGGLRGLTASGRPDVALLMRLFALRGDVDPGVLADAFVALLALSSDDAVPFVAERLASGDRDIARAAAMALGEARRPEAVAALRDHLPRESRPDVRHAVILFARDVAGRGGVRRPAGAGRPWRGGRLEGRRRGARALPSRCGAATPCPERARRAPPRAQAPPTRALRSGAAHGEWNRDEVDHAFAHGAHRAVVALESVPNRRSRPRN